MSDFVNDLKDASDYLNSTKVDIPTGKFDVDPESGTVTPQTQAYSLKEIICSLLAGNGIKLPNLQICLKVNIGRLIPEIPAGLEELKGALEEAEKALDEFIAHTNIDNALGRLNAAVAEFAAIANMINFCGTPVIPRAIPNVLKDSMGSFLGAGKDILDTLGTMADSDIGGCIGTDGNFSPDLFTGGLLKQLGNNFNNLLGMPEALKQSITNDLKAFKTDIENLIEFENNFAGTQGTGGSMFAPNDRVNTSVGMAVDPNLTLSKSQQYASTIQSLYNSLKGYPVDAAGNDIFYYLLEPEILAKLQNNGDLTVPLAEREPVYDHCNRITGYTERTIQTVQQSSTGAEKLNTIQPGVTGLAESGVVLTSPPATTTNLGSGGTTTTTTSSGTVDLSAYSTTAQMQAADAAVTTAFNLADTTATTDRAAIRSEFTSADAVLRADIDTNSALITTNTNNIVTNTSDIATNTSDIATNTAAITALQSGGGLPANATFTNLTTTNFTVTGTGSITLASGNDLSLTATDRVKVTGTTPFKLANMTTTERNAISLPENGDMIYNTTDNKFQGYANSVWVDLH
jgi:hypothetical protein